MIRIHRLRFRELCKSRLASLDDAMPCVTAEDGDWLLVDETHPAYPRKPASGGIAASAGIAPATKAGPGDELKSILRDWLGVTESGDCRCGSMAARMNRLGVEWCESEAGMAEILGAMREEHAKRWKDGRTKIPWTDWGAKRLVLLACRRARSSGQKTDAERTLSHQGEKAKM